jgi:hypothetical protein
MKRRTVLIGLGAVAAGGGAAVGTGAFATVETERSVSVSVAEDSQALVGIEVNERYGGQTDDGLAEFNLEKNVFNGNGFNSEGTTVLYGALAITNNSGRDSVKLQLAYESDSVAVPDEGVPEGSYDKQFYFRDHAEVGNVPSSIDAFEGLGYQGGQGGLATPEGIGAGKTAVFDLVVKPEAGNSGNLTPAGTYGIDVTIKATPSGDS